VKVGLGLLGDESWMAGQVIVRDLLVSVRDLDLEDVRLSLVAEAASDANRLRASYPGAAEYLFVRRAKRFSAEWVGNRVASRFLKRDLGVNRFLKREGIDVYFGYCIMMKYWGLATLSWIPDFQHVRLPEMFSKEEIGARDQNFRTTAEMSTRVVLLSRAVQTDFRDRFPELASKTRVLSPVSRIPRSIYDTNPGDIVKQFNLPDRFFYVPNQFWRHKNHELVFKAVAELKRRGVGVNVVCTGYPSDHRHIQHFTSLWEKVSRWGIRDQVIYLGQVPHLDVFKLIRQAVCVLNPSRFEGWGISVDEARSVGKRILASAVPSHLEQEAPAAVFFDPESVEDLQEKMVEIWERAKAGPDPDLEKAARDAQPERLRKYGAQFVTIAREAQMSAARASF
jgi:glycosyltransferase involved in cell wall biosynthesis